MKTEDQKNFGMSGGVDDLYDPFFVDTPPIPPHPDDPYMGKCECCGEECERRPGVRFCSMDCKNNTGRFTKKPEKPCKHCSEPFHPQKSSSMFCSRSCRVAFDRAKAQIDRMVRAAGPQNCMDCEKPLQGTRSNKRFCDKKCQQRYRNKQLKAKHAKPIHCAICKVEFIPPRKNSSVCSEECKEVQVKAMNRESYSRKTNSLGV